MFRGLSSGKFNQLYEVFGTGPLMPDTLNTFRALLDQPFPKHWRAKVPQQAAGMPGAHPAATSIASLTIEVRRRCWTSNARWCESDVRVCSQNLDQNRAVAAAISCCSTASDALFDRVGCCSTLQVAIMSTKHLLLLEAEIAMEAPCCTH